MKFYAVAALIATVSAKVAKTGDYCNSNDEGRQLITCGNSYDYCCGYYTNQWDDYVARACSRNAKSTPFTYKDE